MSAGKATPGPWFVGLKTFLRPTFTIYNQPFGLGDVAEVYEEADARLIAAAPALLEALQAICDEQDAQQGYATPETYDKARAAIALAGGE